MKKRTATIIILIVVACLILLGIVLGLLQRKYIQDRTPVEFYRTYTGLRWTAKQKDPMEQEIEIIFAGERTQKGIPFKGDITIKSGDETVFYFDDCFVYRDTGEGRYVISPTEFSEGLYARFYDSYGFLYANADWSEVSFSHLNTEPELINGSVGVVFTAPVENIEDAVETSARLAEGTGLEIAFRLG